MKDTKVKNEKPVSPYMGKEPNKKKIGRKGYNPEHVYRYLFDNSDRYGIIIYSMQDLSDAIKMSRETLSYFCQDFMELGLLEKVNRTQFRVLVDPDRFSWDQEFLDKFSALRKKHQHFYRQKEKEK